jgi:hypothetical protein
MQEEYRADFIGLCSKESHQDCWRDKYCEGRNPCYLNSDIILRKGSKDDGDTTFVSDLQRDLQYLGFSDSEVKPNGEFDEKTKRAIERFQAVSRTKIRRKREDSTLQLVDPTFKGKKIDGVVGSDTKDEIKEWIVKGYSMPSGVDAALAFAEEYVESRKAKEYVESRKGTCEGNFYFEQSCPEGPCTYGDEVCTACYENNCAHFISHALFIAGIDNGDEKKGGKTCPLHLLIGAQALKEWLDENAKKILHIYKIEISAKKQQAQGCIKFQAVKDGSSSYVYIFTKEKIGSFYELLNLKEEGVIISIKYSKGNWRHPLFGHTMIMYRKGTLTHPFFDDYAIVHIEREKKDVVMHSERGYDRFDALLAILTEFDDKNKPRVEEAIFYRPKYPS